MSAPEPITLHSGVQALGLSLNEAQEALLLQHLALIAKWNRVYNLTALRDPQEMLSHHLLDSLSVLRPLARHLAGARPGGEAGVHLVDVGSGAGLPGVALAIAMPGLRVTCVDAVAKKTGFIRQVAAELAIPRLQAVHGRIEELDLQPADVITSRAFGSLADTVSLTRQHLAPGGVWMAMKGKDTANERAALPPDIDVFHVEPLAVPGLQAERCLVWMRPRATDERAGPEAVSDSPRRNPTP